MPGTRLRQGYAGRLAHSADEALAKAARPGMTKKLAAIAGAPLLLRQLQLDTAIAPVSLFGIAGVERLKFGKARRDQPLRGDAE